MAVHISTRQQSHGAPREASGRCVQAESGWGTGGEWAGCDARSEQGVGWGVGEERADKLRNERRRAGSRWGGAGGAQAGSGCDASSE